jgi:hypothetical protein
MTLCGPARPPRQTGLRVAVVMSQVIAERGAICAPNKLRSRTTGSRSARSSFRQPALPTQSGLGTLAMYVEMRTARRPAYTSEASFASILARGRGGSGAGAGGWTG